MSSELAVEATGLTKDFRGVRAVDGLDLVVRAGGVFGFLGPNGAGKTTTVRLLATLLQPDRGTARVLGHDIVRQPGRVRERIGLTGQFASIDEDLTAVENLTILARLYGFARRQAGTRAQELLDEFGLDPARTSLVKTYSGGMRRRLDLAASLIITPQLLFLDEPTTGLDPRSRNQVWSVVRALVREGTTVLLTTQYLDEADQLADRLAVIDRGRIVAEGTPSELKSSVGAGTVQVRIADPARQPEAERLLAEVLGVPVRADADDGSLRALVDAPSLAAHAVTSLGAAGIDLAAFAFGQPSLDEVFLTLTGQTPDAHEKQGP